MKRKILTLAILSSLSTAALAQSSSPQMNSDLKVTAVVKAGCDLTADNINFGVLMMPLSDVTANSSINLKCSKGAALTLGIDYSNTGSLSSTNYTVTSTSITTKEVSGVTFNYINYKIYVNGVALSSHERDFMCSAYRGASTGYAGGGREYIQTQEFATLLGVSTGYQTNISLCDVSTTSSNGYKEAKLTSLFGVSIGILNGLTSGEQIKYYLEKPNNTEQWSSGYVITATGEDQSIPMKANIKRADNVTYRMTPDTYQSSLTVVLSY